MSYHSIRPAQTLSKQSINSALAATGSKYSHTCCALNTLACISGVALFILACLATKGAVSSSLLCKATIGLSAGSMLLSVMAGNFKNQSTGQIRKFSLALNMATTVTAIALAALGLSGTLSATQVGWGLLGTTLSAGVIGCLPGSLPRS
jgi:hypothetical protein